MLPRLTAVTAEAKAALAGEEYVELTVFPFRFGRESRSGDRRRPMALTDRRLKAAPLNNNCYLLDFGEPLHISREHFQIERDEDMTYFVVDRGSACGTIVDGEALGNHQSRAFQIVEDGSVIVVGTPTSPYQFRLELGDSPEIDKTFELRF